MRLPPIYGIKNMLWGKQPPVAASIIPVDQLRSSATISDLEFVRAIAKLREPIPAHYRLFYGVNLWDLAKELDIHQNRVKSKFRRAEKRILVDGCNCGCRGGFTLLPAGEELLKENR